MASASLLTPRADQEADTLILAPWHDQSSVDVTLAVWPATEAVVGGTRFAPDAPDVVALFATARFAERVEALRTRVRLPAQKYARLLGVSRRTLYHWLETGRSPARAVDRVEHLNAWVDELERHLSAGEIERLLDPDEPESIGALLVDHGVDAAAERVRLVAGEASRPRQARRLDTLADDPEGEPPTATPDELRAAFAAFAAPRRAAPRTCGESEPPELTH